MACGSRWRSFRGFGVPPAARSSDHTLRKATIAFIAALSAAGSMIVHDPPDAQHVSQEHALAAGESFFAQP